MKPAGIVLSVAASAALIAGIAVRSPAPPASRPPADDAGRSASARPVATATAAGPVLQSAPYYPYSARLTFVRILPKDPRSAGRWGYGRLPPWQHDYPTAEHNLSKILRELTFIRVRVEDFGGNILSLDDPRLSQFPAAYMSEPGYWAITPEEIEGLRNYLLKGGFIIFDDFGGRRDPGDMYNLAAQMQRAMPELTWVRLDATADIFDSFFQFDPDNLELAHSAGSYRGTPVFYGLYMDNDPDKRLVAIGADGGDFGEFWEFSDRGFYPVDISNEAYKIGINYLIYALTH